MCLTGPSAQIASSMTKAIIWLLRRCFSRGTRSSATPLLAYCMMPDHWHLVVSPRKDGELSHYLRWLSVTHTQRWHARRGSAGTGPLYQGRFKSFPVQKDKHFLLVCRYVERNPVRAGLSTKAAGWRWSALRVGDRRRKALADAAGSMAGPRSVGLEAVGGPAGESEGVGGITPIGNAWIAIRRRRLGAADGTPAAPGIELARPAPAKEKEGKWREGLLNPLCPSADIRRTECLLSCDVLGHYRTAPGG